MPRLSAFVCVWVFLTVGCRFAQSEPLERLLAAETQADGISVTVPTGGCTSKSDFEMSSHMAGDGRAEIEFKRLKPDDCKGNFPRGLKLFFSWNDLKLPAATTLVVKNPVPNATGQERKLNKGTMVAIPRLTERKVAKTRVAFRAKKRHTSRPRHAARPHHHLKAVGVFAPHRHYAVRPRWHGAQLKDKRRLRCDWHRIERRRLLCCQKYHARPQHTRRRHRHH